MSARTRIGLAWVMISCLALACASAPPSGERQQIPAEARRRSALPVAARRAPEARNAIHVVARGETLWRISKRYGTTVDAIRRANGIGDVRNVSVGQSLVVPLVRGVSSGSVPAARRPVDAHTYASRDPRGRTAGTPRFAWPVSGPISSAFGLRRGAHHAGLDIKAPQGTLVRAAEAGRVIHADATLAGYGKLVIVKHAGQLSSVYAHNRRLLVRVGQFVKKGEVLAEVGSTGNATTPHLHFEIRRNGRPSDPLGYLQ